MTSFLKVAMFTTLNIIQCVKIVQGKSAILLLIFYLQGACHGMALIAGHVHTHTQP